MKIIQLMSNLNDYWEMKYFKVIEQAFVVVRLYFYKILKTNRHFLFTKYSA
jgi:hypothetical protein